MNRLENNVLVWQHGFMSLVKVTNMEVLLFMGRIFSSACYKTLPDTMFALLASKYYFEGQFFIIKGKWRALSLIVNNKVLGTF